MKDGKTLSHNLKVRLEGFEYKPVSKSGSKLTVRNEKGEVIHEGAFQSFTSNFMKLLYGNMIGSGTAKAKSLDNTDVEMNKYPQTKMNFARGSGVQKFGIGVGSSSTAVSSSDYALTWVDDLTYQNVIVGTPAIVGTTVELEISREISNTSGVTKTLHEAGLIVGSDGELDENVLIARDLVNIVLDNNEKSTWTYSIVVDFNSTTGGFVKNFLDSFIIDWTETEILADGHSQWSKRRFHQSVVFDSKIWIIGGHDGSDPLNDVYSSPDGSTWTEVLANGHSQWSRRAFHQSVVFDSKIWIIGGHDGSGPLNDVYSSPDGSTWTEVLADGDAPWSRRRFHQAVVFDSKIWIIGGRAGSSYFNDVYSSSDGSTWTEVLADGDAPWSKRRGHQCVIFDSKIWIIGGDGSSGHFNDVYSSPDGSTWTEVLADGHSQWGRRNYHQSVVFDSKIWIIGGHDGSGRLNDVYSSSDGSTWTEVLANGHAQWSGRFGHQCVVFDSKIWIIGGNDGGNLNDVYNTRNQLASATTATDDELGIIVGTSDTAFAETQTALDSKIEHGTGAGELEYGACPDSTVTEEPATVGNTTSMKIAREFTNNSGSSITIKEVGIMSVNGLLCRFIPTTPIVIANGESGVISIVFESEV